MPKRVADRVWADRNAYARAQRQEQELVGCVEKIIFFDAPTGATIAALRTGEVVKIEVEDDELQRGVTYRFLGRWTEHFKHGRQFQAGTCILHQSHDRAGIVRYLTQTARNVGPVTADKLWRLYGTDAVEVLRATPERVVEVGGLLNAEQAQEASDDLRRAGALERTRIDLWTLFDGRGFPRTLLKACVAKWGAKAAAVVRRNPFRLLVEEMPGCGFKRTDKLYLDLGYDPNALKRQMLAAWNALREDMEGNTWHVRGAAVRAIRAVIGEGKATPDEAISLGIRAGWLATREDDKGREWIAEGAKAQAELDLAQAADRLLRGVTVSADSPGCAYFFQDTITGLIKIGFTTQAIGDRKAQVASSIGSQRSNLLTLGQIHTPEPRALETQLHLQFAHLRQHGEWFLAGPDLCEFIESDVALYFGVRRLAAPTGGPQRFRASACWPDADSLDAAVTPHQRDHLRRILSSRLCILSGTPGTGKTFAAAAVIRAILAEHGKGVIAVAAPTGKAAVRITAAMARYNLPLEASTIHRLLGITRNGHDGKGWGFAWNGRRPLPFLFVIIDESSMLDVDLAASLLSAFGPHAHVLLIGDPYQLPPVGHGAPLRDLIAAGVPTAQLTEIKRQDGHANLIVQACCQIKDGKPFQACDKYDPTRGLNLRLVEVEKPEHQVEALKTVLAAFAASGRFDPVWDVQVLTPLNEKSQLARVPLNKILQGVLNPPTEQDRPTEQLYRVGDKLICLKNCWLQGMRLWENRDYPEARRLIANYTDAVDEQTGQPDRAFVANGDIARVVAAEPTQLIAEFSFPTRLVRIPLSKPKKEEREELEGRGEAAESRGVQLGGGSDFGLAYVITGHKSQGSEWPVVIVMADDVAGMVAVREWVYTAISRASKLCIIIGKRSTIDRQCKRISLVRRKTFLVELLKEWLEGETDKEEGEEGGGEEDVPL